MNSPPNSPNDEKAGLDKKVDYDISNEIKNISKNSSKRDIKRDTKRNIKRDVIVSVRLPKGLVDELKDIQLVNHFMDLSDEIRFITRRYCLSFLNSQGQQPQIESLLEVKRKEKLIQDLTTIIDNLKTDQVQNTAKEK